MTCISYFKDGFRLYGIVTSMSFSVNVTSKAGEVTVTTSGDVPDGIFGVSGHEDSAQRSLSVTHRSPDGRYVQNATSVHYKET